jgi:hypothetical protein
MSISQNYPLTSPSLSLDFANTKVLDPRITFSRPTDAVYYDGKTVTKAEENLLLRSQEFDNASWSKSNATVTANTTTAPDGTTTAEKLIENSSAGIHAVYQVKTVIATSYTASVYMKASERTWGFLQFSTTQLGAYFDLTNGVVGTVSAGYTASIQSVSNGWYRCSITTTSTAASWTSAVLTSTGDGVISYTGDGTSGIFIWGAQLEQRTSVTAYQPTTTQPITNYIPTLLTAPANSARFDHDPVTGESLGLLVEEQRTNLQTYSEDFSAARALNQNITVTNNVNISPSGTITAALIVENTATDQHRSGHYLAQSFVAGTSYTASVYVKRASGVRNVILRIDLGSGNFGNAGTNYNLTTLAVTPSTGQTGAITAIGNGWYRLSLTAVSSTSYSSSYGVSVSLSNGSAPSDTSYTGNGSSGIYVWCAQLEAGAFPTSYVKTVASQVTRSADSASMTGTNFSDWYRADEGTLYAEGGVDTNIPSTKEFGLVTLVATSPQAAIGFDYYPNSATINAVVFNGATQAFGFGQPITIPNLQFNKTVLAYKLNDFAYSINGGATSADSSGVVPQPDKLNIGSYLNGNERARLHIKKLSYYPQRLSNENLQSLTS